MDPEKYQEIIQYLLNKSFKINSDKTYKRQLRRTAANYCVTNGKLYRKPTGDNTEQLVIQEAELQKILVEIHDTAGHQGINNTYNLAHQRYYWPNQTNTIEKYVKNCERCKKNQISLRRPTEALKPLPVIARPWYRVGMDLTGPLVLSNGYIYILTMVDHFTKWVETRPLKSKQTAEVARAIFSIYCSKGAPSQIISDNGPEFTSKLMSELQSRYNCRLIFSAPYHPQTNGLVEAYHKIIKASLCKTIDDKKENWAECLEQVTFSLNIRPRSDSTGFSAFELMHGFGKARLPSEIENIFNAENQIPSNDNLELDTLIEFNREVERLKDSVFKTASRNLLNSKEKMKRNYDKNLNSSAAVELKVGDNVLIPNRKRRKGMLEDKWEGPFPIKKLNKDTMLIVKGASEFRIKRTQVKLWTERYYHPQSSDSTQVETLEIIPSSTQTSLMDTHSDSFNSELENVLDMLNSMREEILHSIKNGTYLSKMHEVLHQKHLLMSSIEFKQFRYENYGGVLAFPWGSPEVADILREWYIEALNLAPDNLPISNEDSPDFDTYNEKTMAYVEKVLHPVVGALLAEKKSKNRNA